MARASASRELLASREDVWAFLAEPRHFSDWWPGVAAVTPGRRGLVPGARWEIHGVDRPTLLKRATSSGMLLVREVVAGERFAWTLTGDYIDADLRLEESGPTRTIAVLEVEAPWLHGLSRALPRRALARLYARCQSARDP
jgi:uncharacterized protein YndB with AHSA1/START domain